MQIIASYIQLIVIYNSTAQFLRAFFYDFFLKLKICMDKNFLPWLFPDFFQKILNYPDFSWFSNKFPDFLRLP